jgi:hypothetical protein
MRQSIQKSNSLGDFAMLINEVPLTYRHKF